MADIDIISINVVAKLDVDKSYNIISNQLRAIKNKINRENDFTLSLKTKPEIAQASKIAQQANKEVKAAQAQLKPLATAIKIDGGDINKTVNELNTKLGLAKPVELKIDADMNSFHEIESQLQVIAADMAKIQGFDVGRVSVKSDPTTGIFKSADISYIKDGISQTVKDTIRWVDETKKVKPHYEYTRKAIEDTAKAIKQQTREAELAAKAQDALFKTANNFVNDKLGGAFDPNKDNNVLGAKNYLTEILPAFEKIQAIRDRLNRTGDKAELFDAKGISETTHELDILTSQLKLYIANAQHANTYAQSFKPVDITGGAISAMQKINSLALDIRKAGVDTEYFQKEVANLYTAIQNVDDASGLTNIDEQLKILRGDFQLASKEAAYSASLQKAAFADVIAKQNEYYKTKASLYSGANKGESAQAEINAHLELVEAAKNRAVEESKVTISLEQQQALADKIAEDEYKLTLLAAQNADKSVPKGTKAAAEDVRKLNLEVLQAGISTEHFQEEIDSLYASLQNVSSADDLAGYKERIQLLSKEIGNAKKTSAINAAEEKKAIDAAIVAERNLARLQKERIGLKSSSVEAGKELDKQIAAAQAIRDKTQAAAESLVPQERLNRLLEVQKKDIDAIKVKSQRTSDKSSTDAAKEALAVQKATAELKLMESKFPKMFSNSGFKIRFEDISDGLKAGTMSAREASAQIAILKKEVTAAGLAGESFGQKINAAFQKFTQYVSVSSIVLSSIRAIRLMVTNITELDASLVEFNKVANVTPHQLEEITTQAFEMGNAIGRAGRDVIDATGEFVKAGYSIKSSTDMARAALVMTNVGDGIKDTTEAASVLIATLRGFKIPEEDVMSVVDKINQVSNNAPINFESIAEGLTRLSGTLSQSGTSIAQTIGLITGGFAQLRDVEKVSAGLLMISQRMRGVGESGEEVDGLAPKIEADFKKIGIAVADTDGELRSTFDVLKDYAKVYSSLSSKQKQYYGELLAGNRQVTVLNAIVQQWKDVEDAVNQANNSVGSAEKENLIAMDSIQGRLNKLTSSWQKLSSVVVESDFIKTAVSGGTDILNILTALIEKLGLIPTLLATTSGVMGFNGTGIFGKSGLFNYDPNSGNKLFKYTGNWIHKSDISTLTELSDMLHGIAKDEVEAVKNGTAFQEGLKRLSPAAQRAAQDFHGASNEVKTLTTGMSGANGVLKNIGNSFLNAAVSFAIIESINLFIKYVIQYYDRQIEKLQELQSEIKQTEEKLDGLNDTFKTNVDRIKELETIKGTSAWTESLNNEYDALLKQNEALKAQTAYYEQLNKVRANQAQKQAIKVLSIPTEHKSTENIVWYRESTPAPITKSEKLEENIDSLKRYVAEVQTLNKAYSEGGSLKEWQKQTDEIKKKQEALIPVSDDLIQKIEEQLVSITDADLRKPYEDLIATWKSLAVEYETLNLDGINRDNLKAFDVLVGGIEDRIEKARTHITDDGIVVGIKFDPATKDANVLPELEKVLNLLTSIKNQDIIDLLVNLDFTGMTPEQMLAEIQKVIAQGSRKAFADFGASMMDNESLGAMRDTLSKLSGEEILAKGSDEAVAAYESLVDWGNMYGYTIAQVVEQLDAWQAEQDKLNGVIDDTADSFSNIRKALEGTGGNKALLQDAIDKLKSSPEAFNNLGAEKIGELIKAFPQLTGALQKYSNRLITSTDLEKEFYNAMTQLEASDFSSKLKTFQTAMSDYGYESNAAKDALEDLGSSFPGLLDNLSRAEKEELALKVSTMSARDAFNSFFQSATKALGIKVDPKNITSAIQQIITLAATATGEIATMANGLVSFFRGIGAVKSELTNTGKQNVNADYWNVYNKSNYEDVIDPNKAAEYFSNLSKEATKSGGGGKSKSEYAIDNSLISGYEELTAQIELLDKAISKVEDSLSSEDLDTSSLLKYGEQYTEYINKILAIYKQKRDMLIEEKDKLQESMNAASGGTVDFLTDFETGEVTMTGYQEALDKLNKTYLAYAETAKKDPTDENTKKANAAKQRLEDFQKEFERWSTIQTTELPETADAWSKYAKQQKAALQSAASNMLDDLNTLIDMTVSMIKQDYDNQLDGLDELQDAIEKRYDAELDALEKNKDAFEDSYDARKQAIDDEYEAVKKTADAKQKALDDEYDARRKILELMKESLQDDESEHDYQRELDERTDELNQLKNKKNALSNDDSLEAAKQRRELEEKIASQQADLDEFVHDRQVELQEDAIDKALDKLSDEKDAKDKELDAELERIESAHTAQIDAIESEKKAYDGLYDSRKEQIEAAKKAEVDSITAQKDAITRLANDNYNIRVQAIAMIESREQSLYDRLINWNKTYGTSIDNDVTSAWQNCLKTMSQSELTIDGLLQKLSQLKNNTSLTGNSDWTILGSNVQEGTYEKPIHFHEGGLVGSKADRVSKLLRFAGKIKSGESAAILQNGEYVLTQKQQKALAEVTGANVNNSNANQFTFSMPINITGDADNSTVKAIENAGKAIQENIMKAFNKQYSISGLRPLHG